MLVACLSRSGRRDSLIVPMPAPEDERSGPGPDRVVMRRVYEEARRIAHSVLARGGDPTWSTTILVNEAFLRLLGGDWATRVHSEPNTIIPVLRRVMQSALTDHHRRKGSAKRPGGQNRTRVYYEDGMVAFEDDPARFLELLEVIERIRTGQLAAISVSDPKRFAEAVELGFILGCSAREIARQLDVPQTTVSRWLRYGRVLLNHTLDGSRDGGAT
jgi:DNA-directed RNA polymerase specialized sigma24 family protein